VIGALRSPERTSAVALALIGAALLVHGLVDVTWETPVLGVMLCLAAGVAPGATVRSLPVALRYGVAAVGAAVAVLLGAGAVRSGAGVVTANDAFLQRTPVQSLATAEDALSLEPRSADAHIAAADARAKLGDPSGAIVDLVAALRLEPDNYTAWLNAARLQQTAFGDPRGAVVTLARAYAASGRRRQVRIELNQAEREAGLPLTR
jgi:tetratricopeptide (TPR) repeat protein